MSEKMPLNYRVSLTRLDDMKSVSIIFILFFVLPIVFLTLTYSPVPPEPGVIGNAILGDESNAASTGLDANSLSNKQLHKMGYPLECNRSTDIEDAAVWIKGDVAKVKINGKKGGQMKYIITPNKFYAYDNAKGVWLAYPPDSQLLENQMFGNITAISFLSSTLNLYKCSIRDFDSTTLGFPDDV